MLRAAVTSSLLLLVGCDGVVGELGEAEAPPAPLPASAPRVVGLDCAPVSGYAPLDVTCELDVVHPGDKPASCTVEPGTGAEPIAIADCLTHQTLTFTYALPGTFTLKVTAADPDGAAVSSTLAITATQRPNLPPVIDGFAAAPATGGAPFTSTLTWAISDPEGDALTCALNDMPVDCTLSAPWTVQTPGAVTVTLTVTDAHGGTATATVTLTAVMPVGDVRILRVEWGQSVVLPDLRLVGQKPALLRVHVLADRPGLSGVAAEVTGRLGATALGTLALTGPVTVPTMEAPSDLAQQWTVTVPAEWIEPNVELTVKIDSADALPETDEANNTQVLRPAVGRATVMQLTAVPVMHQGMTPTVANLNGPLTRVWPIRSVNAQTRTPYTYGGSLSGGATGAWADLLGDIAQLRQMDGSNRNYYGFVRVTYQAGVAGIGYIGQEASVGRDDSISTAQHELGHNMGRNHAPCGGAAGADANYPYANARLGSWGYDAVNRRLVAPNSAYDLMSYCSPEWISEYNYRAVQRFLEAQPNVTGGPSAPYVTALAVSGHFGLDGLRLRPVHRVLTRLPQGDVPYTGRTLKVTFADGRERVTPIVTHEIADLDTPMESFFALIEDLGPVAAIEVSQGSTVLLRRVALLPLGLAPRVQVTRVSDVELEVKWDAAAHPVAAVAHLLAGERTTLALGLTGGAARVRVDGLPLDGTLELSLSTGVDAVRLVVPLPGP